MGYNVGAGKQADMGIVALQASEENLWLKGPLLGA